MENVLKAYVDAVLPPERANLLSRIDNILINIGRRDHQIAVENILSLAEEEESATTTQRIEDTLYYELANAISDYGIGVGDPDLQTMSRILTGMHDILGYDDAQAILDITEDEGSPEEILSEILALIYSDDATAYLNCIQYVNMSVIHRVRANLEQRVDEVEEPTLDEIEAGIERAGMEESTAIKMRRFVERYRPEGFQNLIKEGYRLGYDIDAYLNRTLDPEIKDSDYLAREYLAAAVASGESIDVARTQASARLENRIDDIYVLQQAIQKMAGYQI